MKVTFDVRHRIDGRELETAVTVSTKQKEISVGMMQSRVAKYFKAQHVSVNSGRKTERHAEYDYDELAPIRIP